MSIGKLSVFDVKCGVWSSYVDRLNMYLKVNKVADDMKLPVLIASMGDEAYELLVNLASPKEPAALTFDEAVKCMSHHLQPAPSALAERFRFRQRRQSADETIAGYVAELKRLSRYCKFGEKLDDNMRDQFVCGIRSDIIRQRLFAESDDVTYARAVKVATALEAAERDAAAVEAKGSRESEASGSGGGGEAAAVHALAPAGGSGLRKRQGGGAGPAWASQQRAGFGRANRPNGGPVVGPQQRYSSCGACGAQNHTYGSCRYKNFVCSKCQRTGHLRRVCPEWGRAEISGLHFGNAQQMEHAETSGNDYDIEQELNHLCLNDYKPVSVSVYTDSKLVTMEIDTGTAIACISKKMYDDLFNYCELESGNTVFTFINNYKFKPWGMIRPTVRYGNITKVLQLFIIDSGTTSLIGRQWLAELGIKVPDIPIPKFSCNFVSGKEELKHVNDKIVNLLDRYKELFSGGLGRYTGGKATLAVREGAAPVFHRARPLPYALCARVDAELDAMLRAGVIEPVDHSDWASPLVPIPKPDGTLRLCADYKSTLNPVLLIDRYPLPKIDDVLVGLNGNKYFSKIDLSQAYNQVELDESKLYTVINTHRGLFRYFWTM
ncbi:uncharacterized protein K02A2.6-like [Cydia pomonella]|uniref:uncharacterized protein K02A2.6-like n=1 Tax=Cydia pomonella TaxID=82600 RepID=UPI002ADE157E|nr:uncharacterized protein K02A2.6-like [Cydia pomonella]